MFGHIRHHHHRWNIAIALAVTETISYGVLYYAYSVYIVPLEAEFGWTRAQIAGALSLALLVSGAAAVPVGFWCDRHGARVLMTVGALGGSALFVAFAYVTTLRALYAVWFGIGLCMAAVLYEPAFIVVAQWFDARRGTALAIITFTAGFASTIFLPLTDRLISTVGRQQSQLVLAAILALGTVPLHALVLRGRGDSAESPPTLSPPPAPATTLRAALHTRAFWGIALAFGLASLAGTGARVHIIPIFIERGLTPAAAAATAGSIGAMQVVGRMLYAPFSHRISNKQLTVWLFALQGGTFLLLRSLPGAAGTWSFVVLVGAVHGTLTLTRPLMLVEMVGTAQFGRISSVMAVTQTVANTLAPFGTGLLYTALGSSYHPVLAVFVAVSLLGALAMARVAEPVRPAAA